MRWDLSVQEATDLQKELRSSLRQEPLAHTPRTIAGADISHNRFSNDLFACVVVLSFPDLTIEERVFAKGHTTFPYRSGYLSFREIPILLQAFEQLARMPDVIMCDGQGIAHPRRMGIAAHLGLVLDTPSFGCAKSRLYGIGDEPPEEPGTTEMIRSHDGSDVVGAYVRTKRRAKPVIVSPGHRITLEESIALTLASVRGYRIPEPTRQAHQLVNAFRRGEIAA